MKSCRPVLRGESPPKNSQQPLPVPCQGDVDIQQQNFAARTSRRISDTGFPVSICTQGSTALADQKMSHLMKVQCP